MQVQIQEIKKLIQWVLGGRGKKWDDLFNSEPKICFNLTIKDLFISESCIEIKIELNFFTLSRIGTLRVKNEFLN